MGIPSKFERVLGTGPKEDSIITVSHESGWKNTAFFGRERKVIDIVKNMNTNDISLKISTYSQSTLERMLAPLQELLRLLSFGRYTPKSPKVEIRNVSVKQITDSDVGDEITNQKQEIKKVVHQIFDGYKEQDSFEQEIDSDVDFLNYSFNQLKGAREKPKRVTVHEEVESPKIEEGVTTTSTTIQEPIQTEEPITQTKEPTTTITDPIVRRGVTQASNTGNLVDSLLAAATIAMVASGTYEYITARVLTNPSAYVHPSITQAPTGTVINAYSGNVNVPLSRLNVTAYNVTETVKPPLERVRSDFQRFNRTQETTPESRASLIKGNDTIREEVEEGTSQFQSSKVGEILENFGDSVRDVEEEAQARDAKAGASQEQRSASEGQGGGLIAGAGTTIMALFATIGNKLWGTRKGKPPIVTTLASPPPTSVVASGIKATSPSTATRSIKTHSKPLVASFSSTIEIKPEAQLSDFSNLPAVQSFYAARQEFREKIRNNTTSFTKQQQFENYLDDLIIKDDFNEYASRENFQGQRLHPKDKLRLLIESFEGTTLDDTVQEQEQAFKNLKDIYQQRQAVLNAGVKKDQLGNLMDQLKEKARLSNQPAPAKPKTPSSSAKISGSRGKKASLKKLRSTSSSLGREELKITSPSSEAAESPPLSPGELKRTPTPPLTGRNFRQQLTDFQKKYGDEDAQSVDGLIRMAWDNNRNDFSKEFYEKMEADTEYGEDFTRDLSQLAESWKSEYLRKNEPERIYQAAKNWERSQSSGSPVTSSAAMDVPKVKQAIENYENIDRHYQVLKGAFGNGDSDVEDAEAYFRQEQTSFNFPERHLAFETLTNLHRQWKIRNGALEELKKYFS